MTDYRALLEALAGADVEFVVVGGVAAVLHGPHTESAARSRARYEGARPENDHWSVACWFRASGDVFHYDSHFPMNDARCAEVLGVLRALDVLPKTVATYVVPEFFPQQGDAWECGWWVLITLTIVASGRDPAPVAEADVDTAFRPFFQTIGAGADAVFAKRMRELLRRARYAF